MACASGIAGANLKKRIGSIMARRIGSRLSFTRKLLLAAIAVVSVAGPFLFGLIATSRTYAQSQTTPISQPAHQSDPPRLFDVASIKPNLTGGESREGRCFSRWDVHGIKRTLDGVDLAGLRRCGSPD